ncbi:MAG: SlyX family protein [Pseudomonadota bacterium]|jgi:SlyX protein|uniref:SlyX family protein n=1 Tax=Tardiphaga sp. TaxID=1926292 RepID=UPI00334B7D7C
MSETAKDIASLRERIDALETRVAFQDDTIETLNETITAQWKQIDALTRQVAGLGERLQEAESNSGAPRNEPPPHY